MCFFSLNLYGRTFVFCLQHKCFICESVQLNFFCWFKWSALHHFQASGATNLFIHILLSFFLMIKIILMWSVVRLWNISSPNIMIKFICLLCTFIHLAHASRQQKVVTAHLYLVRRQVCVCVCVWVTWEISRLKTRYVYNPFIDLHGGYFSSPKAKKEVK